MMNKHTIALLGLSLCAPAFVSQAQEKAAAPAPAAAPAAAPAPTDAEIKEFISYYLGFQTGLQFGQIEDGPMSADDLDQGIFFRALTDGLKNQVDPAFNRPDVSILMDAYVRKLTERKAEIAQNNAAKGKAYLEENAKKEGVTTTESGLQYKVLSPAEGRKYDAEKDGDAAEASITYEGRLIDGTIFDKAEEPITMPINGVVPGFSEALKLMPIGSEWEIAVPSELAYGEHAPAALGPNSTLIFKLKLHNILPKKGTPGNPHTLTPEMIEQLQKAGMQPL